MWIPLLINPVTYQSGVTCLLLLSPLFLSLWRPVWNFTWGTPEVANQQCFPCVCCYTLCRIGAVIIRWCPCSGYDEFHFVMPIYIGQSLLLCKVWTEFLSTWCPSKKTWGFLLFVVGTYTLAHKFLRPNKQLSSAFFFLLKWTWRSWLTSLRHFTLL